LTRLRETGGFKQSDVEISGQIRDGVQERLEVARGADTLAIVRDLHAVTHFHADNHWIGPTGGDVLGRLHG